MIEDLISQSKRSYPNIADKHLKGINRLTYCVIIWCIQIPDNAKTILFEIVQISLKERRTQLMLYLMWSNTHVVKCSCSENTWIGSKVVVTHDRIETFRNTLTTLLQSENGEIHYTGLLHLSPDFAKTEHFLQSHVRASVKV